MLRAQYATRRRTERPTTGATAPGLFAALNVDPMPWQTDALDVAGELIPDPETGDLVHAYSSVSISVPRRGGKSLLLLVWLLNVITFTRHARAWYTAQSRADAAQAMRDDWKPLVAASPVLDARFDFRLSNGSESVTWPAANAGAYLFAPTPRSLHGRAGDLIMFDESWAFSRARGDELEIAARPLMATRPGAQTVQASAAGDIDSEWWIDTLDRGRAAVEADRGYGHCHVEWTAEGTGLDVDDPATWSTVHPAVRTRANPRGTISTAFLEAEHERAPDQFRRLYLNMTDRTGTASTPIDPASWGKLALDDVWDRDGVELVAAVDCSPEQATTAIVVAGMLDGVPVVELVEYRPGTAWVVERVAELVDTWRLFTVAIDRAGPAGALFDGLDGAGVPLSSLQMRDVAAAAAQFVEATRTRTVRHVSDSVLDVAIAGARRRLVGDGSWLFSRTTSSADVSPLVAASIARSVHPALRNAAPGVH